VIARVGHWAKARVLERRVLTEALQTVRHRLLFAANRPILAVHQMARVGSVTVTRALRSRLTDHHVFHTHYLNPDTIRRQHEQFQRIHRATGRAGLHREFLAARLIQARLRRTSAPRLRVVTLVRDPVARTVSAFLRHFPYAFPELGEAVRDDPANVARLADMYLGEWEFGHRFALEWFDREVRDVLGIDVYATPFPRDAGYAIYGGPKCDLLLIRAEDLDRCAAGAFREFMALPDLVLVTANRTEDQSYAEAARRFVAALSLPADYLERMYGSALARHFYSDAERAAFRSRWTSRP
jgi:hypothetical protein